MAPPFGLPSDLAQYFKLLRNDEYRDRMLEVNEMSPFQKEGQDLGCAVKTLRAELVLD